MRFTQRWSIIVTVVYNVFGHHERNTWHEKTFANKDDAVKHAQTLADEFFKDRNHQNEPDLKLFGPDACDGAFAHWCIGYSQFHGDPAVSVFEHTVH